jgi:uncharacterized protein YggT (Ycf19 family)
VVASGSKRFLIVGIAVVLLLIIKFINTQVPKSTNDNLNRCIYCIFSLFRPFLVHMHPPFLFINFFFFKKKKSKSK